MKDIEKLKVCSRMADIYGDKYEIIDITTRNDISFHPNGYCGCIQSAYDYVFGIRCNHLMWAEGNCEGSESFWNTIDKTYPLIYDDVDFVDTFRAVLVYGNHKGILTTKLIVFHL